MKIPFGEYVIKPGPVQVMSNTALLGTDESLMYDHWQDWDVEYDIGPSRFDASVAHPLQFKIGDKVFTEYSEEFIDLYRKVYLWEKMTNVGI